MKREYYLLGLLLIITVTALTNFWEIGMMGLTVFFLAYLTKGSRRKQESFNGSWRNK